MKPLNQILGFLKKTSASEKTMEAAGELFKKRYQSFQELLSSNNSVLELMADMEEKLSGEFLFDLVYRGIQKRTYKKCQ